VVTLASRSGRYGGPYDTAREQVETLRQENIDALLVAGYEAGDGPELDHEYGRMVQVQSLFPRARFSALFSTRMLSQLVSEIRKGDVIHISFAREAIPIAAAITAILLRKRLILQTHGMIVKKKQLAIRVFDLIFVLPALLRAESLIALTSQEADGLTQYSPKIAKKTILLGNPVRRQFSCPTPQSDDCKSDVLFLARYHARKRPLLFAQAARDSHIAGYQYVYRMIGPDDGERSKVDEVAENCPTLLCKGGVPASEVPTWVASCNVFVLCSDSEPWGNVLIGALALGKPCIVSRSCALAASVASFGAGIVLEGDSPRELHEAVVMLLGDSEFYEQCALNAKLLSASIAEPRVLNRKLTGDVYAINSRPV
jgi:glycosyltransferase involved in cell wall biosynthesis